MSLATTELDAVDSKTKEVLGKFLRDPVTAIGHGLHVEIPGDMYDLTSSVQDDDAARTLASDEKHAAALDLARFNLDAALEFLTESYLLSCSRNRAIELAAFCSILR